MCYSDVMKHGWVIVCLVAVLASASDVEAARRHRRGRVGALLLACSIDGARVRIDGKTVGSTPLKQQEVSAGTHTVTVSKMGFRDFSEKVRVRPGKTVRLRAELVATAGVVKVTADVVRARVTIDGKPVGKVPLEREVKVGTHEVVVSAPGHGSFTKTISADAGVVYVIAASLGPGQGPAVDDLALVPLAGPGDEAGIDDLALVAPGAVQGDASPLAPSPGPTPPSGAGGSEEDDLELTALAPLATLSEDGRAARPGDGLSPPPDGTATLGTTVEPAKPWYLKWWALSGAAAVVATGVVVGVLMATSGGEATRPSVDAEFAVGNGEVTGNSP